MVGQFRDRSDLAFVVLAAIGAVVQLIRDRWLALMLGLIVVVNIYFFANYVGDLDHYLLVTWLACAIWVAVALETIVAWLERRVPALAIRPGVALVALVLPLIIATGNWAADDQSRNATVPGSPTRSLRPSRPMPSCSPIGTR